MNQLGLHLSAWVKQPQKRSCIKTSVIHNCTTNIKCFNKRSNNKRMKPKCKDVHGVTVRRSHGFRQEERRHAHGGGGVETRGTSVSFSKRRNLKTIRPCANIFQSMSIAFGIFHRSKWVLLIKQNFVSLYDILDQFCQITKSHKFTSVKTAQR